MFTMTTMSVKIYSECTGFNVSLALSPANVDAYVKHVIGC